MDKYPKIILVVQEFFIGGWSNVKEFQPQDEARAIDFMKEEFLRSRRPHQVIERCERLIAKQAGVTSGD